MIFTPPNLTDEGAHELMEFFQDFVLALENHYMHQLRRHLKSLDDEQNIRTRINWEDESYPF